MMMNSLRSGSRSANQLRLLKHLLHHHSSSPARAISTAPPSFLKHHSSLSNLFSTRHPHFSPSVFAVRHLRTGRDTSSIDVPDRSYAIRPPFNWGIHNVPEQHAYIVERFGKYVKTLSPGLNFLIPFVDRVAYVQLLKDMTIPINHQSAITKDNVFLSIDGVLYVKIVDPRLASYGVEDPIYAVIQLAQTTMRSELGKITLDKSFEERDALNEKIVIAINEAAKDWGLQCLRYEIRDISPPHGVKIVMEKQVEAERKKRAQILDAEGERQAIILASEAAKLDQINRAEGLRQATILASEAAKVDQVNRAEGLRQATILASEAARIDQINRAQGEAEAIAMVAEALKKNGGLEAASLRIAEHYLSAFAKIAQESTTMLLPANANDPASMVSQSLALYKRLIVDKQQLGHDAILEELKSAGASSTESSSTETIDEKSDSEEAAVTLPKLEKEESNYNH